MQRQVLCGYAFLLQSIEHLRGEMQSGRGSCHRAFIVGVYRLVALCIILLGLASQIGRQGYYTGVFNHLGEALTTCPLEVYNPCIAYCFASRGGKTETLAPDTPLATHHTFFPLLVVADETHPGAPLTLLEGLRDGHAVGFKTEHLDNGPRLLAEQQTGMYHLGVVEH